jgi:hypothetical protein
LSARAGKRMHEGARPVLRCGVRYDCGDKGEGRDTFSSGLKVAFHS